MTIKQLFITLALLAVQVASRADTIYVSNTGNNTVEQYNSSSGVGSIFASTGSLNNPEGLAFDSMGNLYVANVNLNNGNSTIEKYTSGGGSLFANPGVAPAGLAFDSAGNLYVANDDTINTIGKYTPDGGGSVFANAGLNVPEGLAFDSAGNLYVANLFGNSIVKYTPGGVGSIFASTGLSDPTGLAFDSAGNLYVANVGNSTIEKFTPGGVGSVFASNEFGSIGVGSGTPIIMDLSNPEGVAFDSAGNLYAANAGNGTIEEFTPDDVGSLFASGLNNPSFIAIVPAPEPSTLALLTLGLPSLLAIRRKLKK